MCTLLHRTILMFHFFSVAVCRNDWSIIIRLEWRNRPRAKKQKETISEMTPLRNEMSLFELTQSWVDLEIQSKSNSRDSRIPSPPDQEVGRLCGRRNWETLWLHDGKPAGEAVLKLISADMCAVFSVWRCAINWRTRRNQKTYLCPEISFRLIFFVIVSVWILHRHAFL